MRTLKIILIGIGSSALWPLYLGLLAILARTAPWPRSVARPVTFVMPVLGLALFAANLTQLLCRSGGAAEVALKVPSKVARQLRRALLVLVVAALAFLLPELLLSRGLIAPGGRPLTAVSVSRLLALGFEITVWIVVYRLVRSKSALVQWLMQFADQLGWLCRNRRATACFLLGAIGVVICLDVQGYGFTAHRLASAGTQSVLLFAFCWAAQSLLLRTIDNHSWHWIRRGAVSRRGDREESVDHPRDLPKRLRSLTRALVPILGLLIGAWIWNVDLALFRSIGEIPLWNFSAESALTIGDLTLAVVVFLITTGLWIYMTTFFAVFIFPRMPDDPGIRFAAVTLCRYLVLGLGVLAGMSALHLGLEKIGMVLAALGVGLGFGLQEIVSNFVSGIILLMERPIRVGDVVTVAGMTGKVDRINIRATTIINADNQSIIVPNREFITSSLVNWTHKDRIIRVTINLNLAFGTCPDRVADLLLNIAREDPDVLRNPVPSASLESFGESTLNFALHVHVPDPSLAGRVRHRLATQIQKRFQEARIELPMPVRELHVRTMPAEWLPISPLPRPSGRIDPPSPTPPTPAIATVATAAAEVD